MIGYDTDTSLPSEVTARQRHLDLVSHALQVDVHCQCTFFQEETKYSICVWTCGPTTPLAVGNEAALQPRCLLSHGAIDNEFDGVIKGEAEEKGNDNLKD